MKNNILFISFLSAMFVLSSFQVASAVPFFTNNLTFVNTTSVSNNMTFNSTENVSFIVTINETFSNSTPAAIQNITFRLGTPGGTYVNYTTNFTGQNSVPAITNTSVALSSFYINFTQSMFGQAGTYNFTWIARNNTGTTNSSITYIFNLTKAPITPFITVLMNNTGNINASLSYPNNATKGNVSGRFNNTMANDASFNLFRINSSTGTSFDVTSFNASFEDLSAGSYEYIYGTNAIMSNYTVGNSTAKNFTILKANLANFLDVLYNGVKANTSFIYSAPIANANVSGTFNASNAPSGFQGASDISFILFRCPVSCASGTGVNATTQNNTAPDLAVGVYEYIYGTNATVGVNYTIGNSTARNLTVNTTSQVVTILLNDSAANISIVKGGTLNITATSNATMSNVSSNITVYANFTGSNLTVVYSGSSFNAVYNTTDTTGMTAGTYFINAYIQSSLNYTAASNVSLILTVTNPAAAAATTSSSSSSSSSSGNEAKHVTAGPDGLSVTFQKGSDHGVLSVVLETDSPASGVVVTVRKLSGKPTSVSSNPIGKVYNYLSISKSGLADSALKGAKVRFTVDSSWLSQNGYDASNVVLNRFNNGVWKGLVTTMTGSDSTGYTFEAETPGFSTFAVTADKTAAAQPTEGTAAPATDGAGVPVTGETAASSESTPSTSSSNDIILIGGVIVVAIVALVFMMRGKKASKKK
jgi:PGF-pre-PGF domain-containing protein